MNYLRFKLAAWISNIKKQLAVNSSSFFQKLVKGNVLCGTAVCPGTHEVLFVDILSCIVIDLTGIPDFINHQLPVLFQHNQICEVAYQIAKVLVTEPRQFIVLV